jgi:Flp pilus assembly pilin Flp
MNTKLLKNENGIAMVTALMLTMISLTIIMALLYMITAGAQLSGAQKRYKTSLDAAHGGVDVAIKDIVPTMMQNLSDPNLVATVEGSFGAVNLDVTATQACLQAKLTTPTSQWPSGCSQQSNPKQSPDMSLLLPSTIGDRFRVYTKIVDTVKGNSDVSGLQLEGAGVAESSPVLTPQHFPYLYRVEVQGERETNAREQSNVSALYAY